MLLFLESGAAIFVLIAAMSAALEAGRRLGVRRRQQDADSADKGTGAIEGAVFGLMGLLLAFTFSGAMSRFDARRELILKEANAIGTAWLRLDLVPEAKRDGLRGDFQHYVDLRIAETQESALQARTELVEVQRHIWSSAVQAVERSSDGAVSLVLPAINDMFDVANARYVAVRTHPSLAVYGLLMTLALLCSLLAGYGLAGSRSRSRLHPICFVLSLLLAIYVIIDAEFPRGGVIRVDKFDAVLVDLRASMK